MTAKPVEDPKIKTNLQHWARVWRNDVERSNDSRAELNNWIIKAKLAGHSYRQIAEDIDLSIGLVQGVVEKALGDDEQPD